MPLEIRWIASFSASSLHAAAAIFQKRPLADLALAKNLTESAAALAYAAHVCGFSATKLFEHLVPLARGIDSNRELAETAIRRAIGPDAGEIDVESISEAIHDVETAFQKAQPAAVHQLELRAPVLMEQWEARGPGLLKCIGRLTEPTLVEGNADVVLVHPILGGGGRAYILYNCAVLESVLANPHASLPEVVRLGWMLSQLNLDIPRWSETIPGTRLPRVAAIAMLPVALAAAETVELARLDRDTLLLALQIWHVADSAETANTLATPLWQWWQSYAESRPGWAAALAALDRMIE